MTTNDIVAHVRAALLDTNTPLWMPRLTSDLADISWRKLARDFRLTSASYSTARVLRQDPTAPREIIAVLENTSPEETRCDSIPIELLTQDLAERCGGSDVRFFSAAEVVGTGVSTRVEEALGILGTVPTVLPVVCSIVRALHLIDTGDDEIDVSFSEPNLPFSAFVSVPGAGAEAGVLRIAEALLHEAMHLQLTQVEAVVPLVRSTSATYFSPWRNEFRTAQGVLHALYVFRVIDEFFDLLPGENATLQPWRSHVMERRAMIAHQILEIRDFRHCPDLTTDGAVFAARLLG